MEGVGMGFLVFGRSPIHSGRRRSRSPMAVQAGVPPVVARMRQDFCHRCLKVLPYASTATSE